MTCTPKPGTDIHRALCAVVRHPDALDSAELAAMLTVGSGVGRLLVA